MRSNQISSITRRYQTALRQHIRDGGSASLKRARVLGNQALKVGLHTLELAKLHEKTLLNDLLPACALAKQEALIREAAIFFAAANTPIESAHPMARESASHMEKVIEALSQRTVELAASNERCLREVEQRKAAEIAYIRREAHYTELLQQSDQLQTQLRQLSRQVLTAQEEERKRISRELHDVIAQSLTGIHMRLATLKKEAGANSKSFERNIIGSQRVLEESVNIIHQFARDLRPAVLDDLGLVPALESYLKTFTERNKVKATLFHNKSVDQLDASTRTVLFRVAQEALNNVARHAKASLVEITLATTPSLVSMKIHDNGKSFLVDQWLKAQNGNRLGLLGMRERIEMVKGRFKIESAPGKGTTVIVNIPLPKSTNGNPVKSKKTKSKLP
jgi:signal transduction histidine kinase